jgi:epoxyqueuosine reductase QueG
MTHPLSRIDAVGALTAALAPHGLDLIGTAAVPDYDADVPDHAALARLVPGARSVIVVGNGGGAFWGAFQAACARNPGRREVAHPLDAFTREVVDAAVARVGIAGVVLYPFDFPAVPVSFVRLGECAGLGRRSLLGVLLHPVYGPWIALRAAVAVPDAVAAPRPADGFDPCPGCVERACIAACPAHAVSKVGWDVPRCAAFRARDDDPCAACCHARVECVIGRAHRYPPDALAYHQGRARPLLVAHAR